MDPTALAIDWRQMFVPTTSLLELVVRGSLMYLLILAGFRMFRRDAGSLSVSDLLVVVLIADAAQNGMAGEYKSIRDSIWNQEKPTSELRRDLIEKFPAPEAKVSSEAELKRLWSLAKRLVAELGASNRVPDAVKDRAQALADDLEELVAAKDA